MSFPFLARCVEIGVVFKKGNMDMHAEQYMWLNLVLFAEIKRNAN